MPQDGEGEDLELGLSERQESGIVDAGDDWDDVQGGSSADGEGRSTPGSVSAGEEGGQGKK